jgi:hypothetical protein
MALSLAEFEALTPDQRHKHGDVRSDGRFFQGYQPRKTKAGDVRVQEMWILNEAKRPRRRHRWGLTLEEFEALPEDQKRKPGEIRESDGFIFTHYHTGRRNGEVVKRETWKSPESAARTLEKIREKQPHYTAAARKKYWANPKAALEYQRMWRKNNPDKRRRAERRYREKYPDKALQKKRREVARNMAAYVARNRARRLGRKNDLSGAPVRVRKIVQQIYNTAIRVSKCVGIEFQVDHVVPLSKGGSFLPENLRIVPAKVNLRKQDKCVEELPEAWQEFYRSV